jgi:hypothetical protein
LTKQAFVNKYQSVYDLNTDDFDDRIEIMGNKETKSCYDNIVIEFEENTYNIYREFTYNDDISLFHTRDINEEQLVFIQMLGKTYGTPPKLEVFWGMGCPFIDEYVGYFGVKYDTEQLAAILNSLEVVFTKDSFEELDAEYLSEKKNTTFFSK